MAKSSQGGDQLVREARIALPILGLLFLLFIFVGYRRISGWADAPPVNVPTDKPMFNANPNDSSRESPSRIKGTDPADVPRTLPGAEIRRPPNVDRLSQPLRDQSRSNRTPEKSRSTEGLRGSSLAPRALPSDAKRVTSAREPTIPPAHGNQIAQPIRNAKSKPFDSNAEPLLPPQTLNMGEGQPVTDSSISRPHWSDSQSSTIRKTGWDVPPAETGAKRIESTYPIEDSNPNYSSDASMGSQALHPVAIRLTFSAEDSYWTIAERAYGSGQYFRAIHGFLQSQGLEGKLEPGMELILPPFAELSEQFHDLMPTENSEQPSPPPP